MKIAVITTDSCPWCDKVKALLKEKDLVWAQYSLADWDYEPLKSFFVAAGFRTVPQVFIDGKLIGGYEATKNFLSRSMSDDQTGTSQQAG